MFDSIFGIVPISDFMWNLLVIGALASVVAGFIAWLAKK